MKHLGNKLQAGVGLLDIMITVFVVAIGLLGVAALQSNLLTESADNKARSEAMALVQQRLDQLRNYSGEDIKTLAEFSDYFAPVTSQGAFTKTGVNAAFTFDEIYTTQQTVDHDNLPATAPLVSRTLVTVVVSWNSPENPDPDNPETLSLSTELSWFSPRASGDKAGQSNFPDIKSPIGRAHLGEGKLTDEQKKDTANQHDNGDGTHTYDDLVNNEVYLYLEDGTIVLTLEKACDSVSGTCLDFVRINGRVYIDSASRKTLEPGQVLVNASDAAFCQRYYYTDPADKTTLVVVDPSTTAAAQTSPQKDYEYFQYTCYLGGGWHGNVGLLLNTSQVQKDVLNGIGLNDKICVGDPLAALGSNKRPVLAARRAYRGMTHKADAAGNKLDAFGNNAVTSGLPVRYWSIGVHDALSLPLPGKAGHDFVVASFASSDTDGESCVTRTILTRPDSVASSDPAVLGSLFKGVPSDFYCLNAINTTVTPNVPLYDTLADGSLPNDLKVDVVNGCPYDPTHPPINSIHIKGVAKLANLTLAEAGWDSDIRNGKVLTLETTDGPGNCAIDYDNITSTTTLAGLTLSAPYSCLGYDWGSGWSGSVQLAASQAYKTLLSCPQGKYTRTNLTQAQAEDDDTNGLTDLVCTPGKIFTLSGNVSVGAGKMGLDASVGAKIYRADGVTVAGVCQVEVNQLAYTCTSTDISNWLVDGVDDTGAPIKVFNGLLKLTGTGGTVCTPTGGVQNFTVQPGDALQINATMNKRC